MFSPGALLAAAALHLCVNPNAALVISCVGVLLLFFECNRPGYVLPGATGLLLLLLGAHALRSLPLRPGAVCLLALACVVLALPLRLALGWAAAVAGTALLCVAMASLSRQPAVLSPVLGFACALFTGPIAGWLAIVAGQARRAKYHPRARSSGAPRTGQEHWE